MTMSVVQVGLVLIGTFFLLLALSAPVSVNLIISPVLTAAYVMDLDLATFVASQRMITDTDGFSLIVVPFFILCDVLMNSGGIAQKLTNFAELFMGFVPGGLAHTNILDSTLFGSISGSSVTASVTMGGVMIPLKEEEGCDREFVTVANTASAPTRLITPSSGTLITYMVLSDYSVVGMIMSGYIPGFMWCVACMMVAFVIAKKSKYPTARAVPTKAFVHTFIDAVSSLLLIIIIVGGVCSDMSTATESAAVAVTYTLFLPIVCYHAVKIKDLPAILCDAYETTTVIIFLIAASSTMSFAVPFTGLPAAIDKAMLSISSNPYVVLLTVNIIFLVVGTFMDTTPVVLVFTPIFLPVVESFGMHPIRLGIMMIMNLGIGNITPPMGSTLFSGCSVTGIDMKDTIKPTLPFYGAIFATLMLVACVPWFSMVIPALVGAVWDRGKECLTMTFNVLDFGAKVDCVTNGAPAIQAAIDVYSKTGNGRMILEGGKHFYSDSIILEENVDLHLERRVVLRAYKALERYFHPSAGQRDNGVERVGTPVTLKPSYVFIHAKDTGNIVISGEETISRNAYAFARQVSPCYVTGDFYPRPTLAYAEYCNHISFRDVIMRNVSFRTLHPADCDDVLISGLRILNDSDVANSDGIDPDHSTSVRIIDCHVICADDCIRLKSSSGNMEYGPLKDIIILGYTLTSTSATLKIGTEGTGGFENMIVDNCIISDSNRGISIQIRDGGNVRNVSFSNIIIETRWFAEYQWGCAEPITISTHGRDERTRSGHISNVWLSNITCDSENGVFLSGSRGNHIEDIPFESVHVVVRAKSKWPEEVYDLHPGYGQRVKEIKTSGFYMCRANHVILRNYQVKFEGKKENDLSHALYAEKCRDVTLRNFRGQMASSSLENAVIRQDRSWI